MKIRKRLKRLFIASAPDPLRMSPLVACALAENWEAGSLLLKKELFPCYPQVSSTIFSKLCRNLYYADVCELGFTRMGWLHSKGLAREKIQY